MARNSRKIVCTLIGAVAGAIGGAVLAKNKEDRLSYAIGGAVIGGIGGYALSHLLPELKDTIVYTCYKNGKVVYIGICYQDRINERMAEHCCNGKKFTHYTVSVVKTRSQALLLEKRKIDLFKPVYNIQHNLAA